MPPTVTSRQVIIELVGTSSAVASIHPTCTVSATTHSQTTLSLALPKLLVVDQETALTAISLIEVEIGKLKDLGHGIEMGTARVLGLQFDSDGIDAIAHFLSKHAHTVQHLVIHNILRLPSSRPNVVSSSTMSATGAVRRTSYSSPALNEVEVLCQMLTVFANANMLRTIDLSNNYLPFKIWKCVGRQNYLESLLLDSVHMDPQSLIMMETVLQDVRKLQTFSFLNQVDAMTVVSAVHAANRFVSRCVNLQSIRWIHLPPNLSTPADKRERRRPLSPAASRLPCAGLLELASKMDNFCLKRIELSGSPKLSDVDFADRGLCGAIRLLQGLEHLKLENVNLSPDRIRLLVQTIRSGKIRRLRHLDLSNNNLDNPCASALCRLGDAQSVSQLEVLNLDQNMIEMSAAAPLFLAFAARDVRTNPTTTNDSLIDTDDEFDDEFDDSDIDDAEDDLLTEKDSTHSATNTDLHIKMADNPVDMSKLALSLASQLSHAWKQRDEAINDRFDDSISSEIEMLDDDDEDETKRSEKDAENEQYKENFEKMQKSQDAMTAAMADLTKRADEYRDERDTLARAFSVLGSMKHVEAQKETMNRIEELAATVKALSAEKVKVDTVNTTESVRLTTTAEYQSTKSVRMRRTTLSQATSQAAAVAADRGSRRLQELKDQVAQRRLASASSGAKPAVREKVLVGVASLHARRDQIGSEIRSDVANLQARQQLMKRQASASTLSSNDSGSALTPNRRSMMMTTRLESFRSRGRRSSDLLEAGTPTVSLPDPEANESRRSSRSILAADRIQRMGSLARSKSNRRLVKEETKPFQALPSGLKQVPTRGIGRSYSSETRTRASRPLSTAHSMRQMRTLDSFMINGHEGIMAFGGPLRPVKETSARLSNSSARNLSSHSSHLRSTTKEALLYATNPIPAELGNEETIAFKRPERQISHRHAGNPTVSLPSPMKKSSNASTPDPIMNNTAKVEPSTPDYGSVEHRQRGPVPPQRTRSSNPTPLTETSQQRNNDSYRTPPIVSVSSNANTSQNVREMQSPQRTIQTFSTPILSPLAHPHPPPPQQVASSHHAPPTQPKRYSGSVQFSEDEISISLADSSQEPSMQMTQSNSTNTALSSSIDSSMMDGLFNKSSQQHYSDISLSSANSTSHPNPSGDGSLPPAEMHPLEGKQKKKDKFSRKHRSSFAFLLSHSQRKSRTISEHQRPSMDQDNGNKVMKKSSPFWKRKKQAQ